MEYNQKLTLDSSGRAHSHQETRRYNQIKSTKKCMFIMFFNSTGIVHKKFVPVDLWWILTLLCLREEMCNEKYQNYGKNKIAMDCCTMRKSPVHTFLRNDTVLDGELHSCHPTSSVFSRSSPLWLSFIYKTKTEAKKGCQFYTVEDIKKELQAVLDSSLHKRDFSRCLWGVEETHESIYMLPNILKGMAAKRWANLLSKA